MCDGGNELTDPETGGAGELVRSGGTSEAFPMPLGSESTLGLAGPNGTPLIAELPAPADPAGGVSCAKACAGTKRPPSAKARTSAELRDIQSLSGGYTINDNVGHAFPRDDSMMTAITVRNSSDTALASIIRGERRQ